MRTREEMLFIAKREYESIRGVGSWERDEVEIEWQNHDFRYLTELVIRSRAGYQACRNNLSNRLSTDDVSG